jgi:phosphohistidine phosphatase
MKSLLLLRHAKSSWAEPGISDFDRPLNERGKRTAPRVGEILVERGLRPDLVLSSPAKRARKTARKVLEASGLDVPLQLVDALYLAPPPTYSAELQSLSDLVHQVLVVGHNPGLEELLGALTGRPQHMPTAALANVELPIESWSEFRLDGSARLVWFWAPADDETD